MVRVGKLVMAMAAATALASEMAHALGLGEITLQSSLNQPLAAEIELLDAENLSPGEVIPALASIQAFNKAGIDRQYFLTDLTFTPVLRAAGKSVIRVTSSKPVREPYLNFLVEVLWPSGRLLREYTLLLDPPLYSSGAAAAVAPQLPIASMPQASRPQKGSSVATPPAANPSASPAAQAVRANEYRTLERDTLWQIAERTRQGGSVQQSMLAIQALNPDAFIDGNINRMKSGQVLRLPDAQQIASRGRAEAMAEVAEQNAAWRQERRVRPARARQIDATQREAAGAAPSRSESGDKLRLVAAGSGQASAGSDKGAANDIKALHDRLAASQESLDSTRRENAELAERLNDLQSQLDKLQRLMALKDSQLARLQAQLSSEGSPAVADSAPVAEAAKAAASAAGVESTEAAPEQASEAVAATPAEPAAPEPVARPAPVGQPESSDKPAATNPDSALGDAARPAFLNDLLLNPLLLGIVGGGALLLLLIGLMVLSRRNAMREAEVQSRSLAAAGDEYGFDPAEVNYPGPAFDGVAEPAAGGDTQVGGVAAWGGDLLSEADIYIAYGRFNQAAELLHKALNDEPQRGELRLKLMEVYAELGDRDGFLREEAELREIGGADAGIEQLRARYPALGLVPAMAASAGAASSEELDSFDLEALDFDLDEPAPHLQMHGAFVAKSPLDDEPLELQNASPVEGAMVVPSAGPWQGEAMGEFSLDVERDALDTAEEASRKRQLEEFSLDLEGDGGDSGAEGDDLLLNLGDPLADTSAADEEDFSFEWPATVDAGRDFSEDFDLSQTGEADGQTPATQRDEMTAELRELSRQFGEIRTDANEIRPSVADSDTGELDEDFDFLSGTDETTTKLDLARAYIDMGDADGARDILDEVIGEGSDSQQQEAREMLAQLN